tara:strand:- start:614 stop:808 length:195 start_codon:yes stop_codon:yes gene_type:complete
MGEAKRRRELGLPPKTKKDSKSKTTNSILSLISIEKLNSQYPAAPFVTTAIVLAILQFGFSLNS